MKPFPILLLWLCAALSAHATGPDTLRHWGVEAKFMPAREIAADSYMKLFLRGRDAASVGIKLIYSPLPTDSDAFAADYGYPTIGFGLRYDWNHSVTLRRDADPAWGLLEPVNYTSHLGNAVGIYAEFARPLFRTRRWEADYAFQTGIGYNRHPYNTYDNIDNELIGSHWIIYFNAGLHLTWRFADDWGLRAGVEFYHYSNGALDRPNKGANAAGPVMALVYCPYFGPVADRPRAAATAPFTRYWYLDFTGGIAAKTMNEDWQKTQFRTSPGAPRYRTDRFKLYTAWSAQANLMYRYARRWASGIGFDLFYGTYAAHIADMDRQDGYDLPHSPWSCGIAARHVAFWHQFSAAMALGVYLYREMGDNARKIEAPYYEQIGIHYAFKHLLGLKMGLNVKAHRTKADYTEFVLGLPVRLRRH